MKFVQVVLVLVVTLLFEDYSAAKLTAPTAEEIVSGAFNYHNSFGIRKAARIGKVEDAVHKLSKLRTFNSHHKVKDDVEILNNHTSNYLRKNVSMKIVQGSRAKLGQFPYQAGLRIRAKNNKRKSYCGASLISTTRLLTAAHCCVGSDFQADYFIVVLGSTKLRKGGTRIKTKRFIVHERYSWTTHRNDIAIISIPSVKITKYIQPIALPPLADKKKHFAGYIAVASGFGDDGTGLKPRILMYVNLKVKHGEVCSSYYDDDGPTPTTVICTKGVDKRNICFGDSGGPLAINGTNGDHVLIGVTSRGEANGCLAGAPSKFTRITSFLPWIGEHMISK